jgi:response regulator RpfG family c-di-GMP phosphodiesterase
LDKGVNYIYIPKDKFEKLIKDYLERIQSYHLPEETIQLTSQALHLSLSSLTEMGLSDFQFELITSVVDETISELSNNKKLSKLFSTYLKNESYIVSHSLYTIYIAGLILKETHYSYTHTMKKISYAAFLHDLALETDPFAEYEMHLRPELTSAELKKVEEHPINSAKLIPDDNDMFEDARKIILEHHEKPNGTGYPKKLDGTKTFTLSCVFNIAHDISTFLIKNEYQVDLLPTFLQRNKEYYSIGNYEKFYQIALTIF